MRAIVLALLLVLVTTGATCQRRHAPPVADAPVECRRAHYASGEDTGVRWTADPEDPAAFDALAERVLPEVIRRGLATERARQACVGFIDDLHRRNVIRKE